MNTRFSEIIIKILSIKGIGRKAAEKLFRGLPSVNISDTELNAYLLSNISNLDKSAIIQGITNANILIDNSTKLGISFVDLESDYYPLFLKLSYNPPLVLSYKGELDLTNSSCICVIGAREGTVKGFHDSYTLSKLLSERGHIIVSGLAMGCDKFAHEGSLDANGKTIAVLANSLDYIYPKENKRLADQIVYSGGLLLSETLVGDKLHAGSFLKRNRILIGLCKFVLVAEASYGGTLNAINLALKSNKELIILNSMNLPRLNMFANNPKVHFMETQDQALSFISTNT